jgi:hypothetical protein
METPIGTFSLQDSCYHEACFAFSLRPGPDPSSPQADTVGLTAIFFKLMAAMRLLSLAILFFLAGCAAAPKGGFWGELKAEKSDETFHLVRYVGAQKNCFPPIANAECVPPTKDAVLYDEIRKVEMEEFSLSLPTRDFFSQAGIKDMLYLAASELSLQRGFSMFTVTWDMEISMCRNYGSDVSTSGTVNRIGGQGFYSGKTTVTPRDICGGSHTIKVLMFNDKALLAEGIFERSNSGPIQSLRPKSDLYFGTMPGLRYGDFNSAPEPGVLIRTPRDAWKTHFDAKGLAADLRVKYKLGDTGVVPFRDMLVENLKREAEDPLTRNRVISK